MKSLICPALEGLAISLLLLSCSPDYSSLVEYQPTRISCIDHSISATMSKAEHDFIRVMDGESGMDIWHSSPQMRQRIYEAMQSSKNLANSGNPYGMGLFGDMMQSELKLDYLKEQHVFNSKEATAVQLPESMRTSMVGALSYLYIAAIAKGDPGVRAQRVIDKISHPATIDGSSIPDYVPIPDAWFKEAKANANAWKIYCSK